MKTNQCDTVKNSSSQTNLILFPDENANLVATDWKCRWSILDFFSGTESVSQNIFIKKALYNVRKTGVP